MGACVNMCVHVLVFCWCGVHVRACVRVHVCVQLKVYLPTDAYVPAYVYVVWMCVYMQVHVLCMHVGIHRVQCTTVLQVTVQPHEYCIRQQHCSLFYSLMPCCLCCACVSRGCSSIHVHY